MRRRLPPTSAYAPIGFSILCVKAASRSRTIRSVPARRAGIERRLTQCLRAAQHPPTLEQRAKPVSRKSYRKADRVVRHTLADGTIKEYRYARNRKPRMRRDGDTLGDLIAAWQISPEWAALAPSTQTGYVTYTRPLLGMENVPAKR